MPAKKTKKWHWQYLIGILLATILNVDASVVPTLKWIGVAGWQLFLMVVLLSSFELPVWLWFWSWFGREVVAKDFLNAVKSNGHVQEGIGLCREMKAELKENGLLDRLRDYLLKTFLRAVDENSRVFRWIKRGGYVAMLGLGLEPYPFGRTIGVIFCGMARCKKSFPWKKYFCALMLGNILRVIYVVGLWNAVFSFCSLIVTG